MGYTMRQMVESLEQATAWAKWELESLTDFHHYAQEFGATPGSNVFQFVLQDALRSRGMTLEQFRAKWDEKEKQIGGGR